MLPAVGMSHVVTSCIEDERHWQLMRGGMVFPGVRRRDGLASCK